MVRVKLYLNENAAPGLVQSRTIVGGVSVISAVLAWKQERQCLKRLTPQPHWSTDSTCL